jgi:aspartyl-tRNA(Asn)/glutamyl-tRNA(Gln) amidotransferase subunit A
MTNYNTFVERYDTSGGIGVAVKANIATDFGTTDCCSKILQGYKSPFNATVVDRLLQSGYCVVGKTNMDEFAMGCSGATSVYGAALNPHDPSRTAGGSSGGSAAAVAAGEVAFALGSDTGGSIRIPAAYCGVTAIRPTYGTVSRHGLIAMASSMDQIGTIAANVGDCAKLLSVISGKDEFDSTCVLEKSCGFADKTPESLSGLRIGLYADADNTDPQVKSAVTAAAEQLKSAGAAVSEVALPLNKYAAAVYYTIACAEASSNLAKFDGLKFGYRSENARTLDEVYRLSRSEGFGAEVKRRIMLGALVLSAGYYEDYYRKSLRVRTLIMRGYADLLGKGGEFDVILTPTAPTVAPKLSEIGGFSSSDCTDSSDIYTAGASLAGLPAITLPCGQDSGGMPIGLQLIGAAFSESRLVSVARLYEKGRVL